MWSHAAASWAQAQRGRWQEALAHCNEGIRVGEEYHDDSVVCFSAYMLSIACTGQGDLEIFERLGTALEPDRVRQLLS